MFSTMQSNKQLTWPWLIPFCADVFAIVAAYATTYLLRFHSDFGVRLFNGLSRIVGTESGAVGDVLQDFYIHSALRLILIIAILVCTLYVLRNLYAERDHLLPRAIAWDVVVANATALVIFYAYWYLTRNVYHPRSVFASLMVLNTVFCIAFRHLSTAILAGCRKRLGVDQSRTLLAGHGRTAESIADLITNHHPHGLYIGGRINTEGIPFDVGFDQMQQSIRKDKPDLLICADPNHSVANIMQILDMTQTAGIPVKILSHELGILTTHAHVPCDHIHGEPLIHFDAPRGEGRIGKLRQGITLLVASVMLLLVSPLLLLIALLIRLTSHGPALFIQERIGVNRRPFRLYKFRTMHTQAEELLAQIEEFNESEGALFKIKKDPRITPIGRILRRFSLDELPQLFNVIKGDMVLVGPRPLPRRDFENYYEQWHYSRHAGLPGLTCLWQISGRSNISFHNMCILDVYYLRNHSWIMDFKIAHKTIRVVCFGEGAY
ncbi:MAG TPA: hypothetical protein DCS43_10655 [Verrucomicrobia bacterium]|nr:hypothetical protein [Verrucomicrobiota bacterium]